MISLTAEYALRAATFLSRDEGTPRKAQEISISTQIPSSYIQKVLTALSRARLLKAQRGPRGGYFLARPAHEISAFDVITAVAPWERMDSCPLLKPEHAGNLRPLHRCIAEAQALLEKSFRNSSLRELMEETPPASQSADS